ncbi:FAD-dependent oxidoreductase [Brachybacterium sp. NPDC056505]|uniref:FAD-dependent oxidoreductase n=1 Tax=Brachybacterium sp. NPDC056505 TaxID=3345843 RepID=UPI0036713C97
MLSVWRDTSQLPSATGGGFTPGAEYDTVVVGAGLTGLTTAVLLARAGQHVAVLEARSAGAVTTGNTTGKVSLLQGTVLSQISRHQPDTVLRAYVDANREGQAWLLRYLDEKGIDYQRRSAYTYATTAQGVQMVRQEQQACATAGLPVTWARETELPFNVSGAIALAGQAQINSMDVLGALAAELHERGGELIEGVRVTGAGYRSPVEVHTDHGSVRGDRLVLATGTPILDRGAYFAKLSGNRSYGLTYRVPAGTAIPKGMYISADSPTRTLRGVPLPDEEQLLIGGNDHAVGRAYSPRGAVEDLESWAQQHYPGAERTHTWSAQDYRSTNYIPFIGRLPRGGGHMYLATGYNKRGLATGVAAALAITSQILDGNLPWAKTLGHRITTPSDLLTGAKDGTEVGVNMATGWVDAVRKPLPKQPPAEGRGLVGREHGRPVAVSTVDGDTRRVSAVCTHMGGVLRWNDAECSWDCPLHASRFSADGTVLEGPAIKNLKKMPSPEA